MKKFLLLLTGVALSSIAIAQNDNQAQTRLYVQPSLWLAIPGGDFEEAGGLAAAIGVQFKERHHVEVEVGFFNADITDSVYGMEFMPALLNYEYAFPLRSNFAAYAGITGGAIFQKIDVNNTGYGEGETKSAGTFGLAGGARYGLTEHFSIDVGGKVLRLSETKHTSEGTLVLLHASFVLSF